MNGPDVFSPLVEELRSRTEIYHRQLEAVPFTRALASGELAVESYVGMLRATAVVRAVLERRLNSTTLPEVMSVWKEPLKRFPYLERDLSFFRERNLPDIPPAMEAALAIAEKIRVRSEQVPLSLLGALYVLEGSMKGAPMLRRLAARSFAFEGDDGLRYLGSGESTPANTWNEFVSHMNSLVLDKNSREHIMEAAIELFKGLISVFQALHPVRRESMRYSALSLNPEAGMHRVPSDPRELAAAARAGEICWLKFPYLEMRYGDRGRRFTASDSGWLVTLADSDQTIVNQQVLWLGRVLAARGLPRIILEDQLRILHAELSRDIPEKEKRYEILLFASQMLGSTRASRLAATRFDALTQEFESKVRGEAPLLPNVGCLLVSAVIDENDGISEAVTSILGWVIDPGRFSPAWIRAVNCVISSARQAVLG